MLRPATSASSSRTRTRVPGVSAAPSHRPRTARVVEHHGALAVLGVDDHGVELLPLAAAQQPGLDGIDRGALDVAGAPVGRRHQTGQLGQRGAQRVVGLPAGGQRQADLGAEPVDQPAQRRGDVRVRRGDAAVQRLLGRGAVERRVARAAQQGGRLLEERGVPGPGRVETRRSPSRGARRRASGRRARGRAARSRATSSGRAGGSVRSTPTPPSSISAAAHRPVSSEICAFQASTGRSPRRASVQPPPSARTTSCSGVPSSMAPTVGGPLQQEPADLRQQRQRLGQRARVGLCLHRRVVELGAAAHPRPAQPHLDRLAVGVQVDAPQDGGPELVGQQARGALAEDRRGAAACGGRGCRASARGGAPRRRSRRPAARTTPTSAIA